MNGTCPISPVTVRIAGEEHARRANADLKHTGLCPFVACPASKEIPEKADRWRPPAPPALGRPAPRIPDHLRPDRAERARREVAERNNAAARSGAASSTGGEGGLDDRVRIVKGLPPMWFNPETLSRPGLQEGGRS